MSTVKCAGDKRSLQAYTAVGLQIHCNPSSYCYVSQRISGKTKPKAKDLLITVTDKAEDLVYLVKTKAKDSTFVLNPLMPDFSFVVQITK